MGLVSSASIHAFRTNSRTLDSTVRLLVLKACMLAELTRETTMVPTIKSRMAAVHEFTRVWATESAFPASTGVSTLGARMTTATRLLYVVGRVAS